MRVYCGLDIAAIAVEAKVTLTWFLSFKRSAVRQWPHKGTHWGMPHLQDQWAPEVASQWLQRGHGITEFQ